MPLSLSVTPLVSSRRTWVRVSRVTKIYALSLSKIFNISKGSPSIFLILFCNKLNFQNSPKGHPFTICGIVKFFEMIIFRITDNETFCEQRELLGVFLTMLLTGGNPSKKFSKEFEILFNFSFFFQEDKWVLLSPMWEKVFLESYAYPFGYFLAL